MLPACDLMKSVDLVSCVLHPEGRECTDPTTACVVCLNFAALSHVISSSLTTTAPEKFNCDH